MENIKKYKCKKCKSEILVCNDELLHCPICGSKTLINLSYGLNLRLEAPQSMKVNKKNKCI